MTTVELSIKTPATEWTVYQGKTCSVQVRSWHNGHSWAWNVYALIFDGHRLHQNVEGALGLPFHWGATYEKRVVTSPAQGVQYNWEKISDVLKLGSDYLHCDDEWAEECDPKYGIPRRIQRDALELARALDVELVEVEP